MNPKSLAGPRRPRVSQVVAGGEGLAYAAHDDSGYALPRRMAKSAQIVDVTTMDFTAWGLRVPRDVAFAVAAGSLAATAAIVVDLGGDAFPSSPSGIAIVVEAGALAILGLLLLRAVKRGNSSEKKFRHAAWLYQESESQLRSVSRTPYEDVETRLGTLRQLKRDAAKEIARSIRLDVSTALAVVHVGGASELEKPLRPAAAEYLAGILLAVPRVEDGVYRIGVRMFAVLLTSCPEAGANAFAARLRTGLPEDLGDDFTRSTVGAAACDPAWTLDELFNAAEQDRLVYESLINRRMSNLGAARSVA